MALDKRVIKVVGGQPIDTALMSDLCRTTQQALREMLPESAARVSFQVDPQNPQAVFLFLELDVPAKAD